MNLSKKLIIALVWTCSVSFISLAPAKAAATELKITFTSNGFSPQVLEVPSETLFKIVLVNETDSAVEFESLRLRKEKVLAPGASSFIVIRGLSPGRYDFIDDFHPTLPPATIFAKEATE